MESQNTTYLGTILGEELDGWETMHFNIFKLVCSGIHFGNNNVCVVLVFFTKLVPRGGQLFAVSAPGSVELNKDALVFTSSDFIEVLANKNLNGFRIPIFGYFFRHQVWLLIAHNNMYILLNVFLCFHDNFIIA